MMGLLVVWARVTSTMAVASIARRFQAMCRVPAIQGIDRRRSDFDGSPSAPATHARDLRYSPLSPLNLNGGAGPVAAGPGQSRKFNGETPMKKVLPVLASALLFAGATAHADEATEREVIKSIMDGNAYAKKNLRDEADTVAKDGSLEFWSSGGFLQKVAADSKPSEYESVNIDAKHIEVITLVPGKVAVAQYYSEGSMAPKGSAAVSNYRTRATQVFVKEDGKWKVRAAHWSPIASGSGTSQTAVD